MPKDFDECVKNGGKLRTKKLKNDRYIHICYDKKGKAHSGEVMTKKKIQKEAKANRQRKQIDKSRRLAASLERLKNHFNSNYRN